MIFTTLGKLVSGFGLLTGVLALLVSTDWVQEYMVSKGHWPSVTDVSEPVISSDEYGMMLIFCALILGVLCDVSDSMRMKVTASNKGADK